MPRTHCWGRRVHLSTDDFVFAATWSALVRAAWFLAALGLLLQPSASPPCAPLESAQGRLALGACVLSGLALVQDALLALCSSRGTPLHPAGRESVPAQASLRAATALAEVVLAALALAAALGGLPVGALPACSGSPVDLRALWLTTSALALASAALSSAGYLCLFACSFLCSAAALKRSGAALSEGADAAAQEQARAASAQLWHARWRAVGALTPGAAEADAALRGAAKGLPLWQHLGDVAALAFQPLSQLDMTVGDTLTGLALFTTQQQAQAQAQALQQQQLQQQQPTPFDWTDAAQRARLAGATRYMHHCYAAYAHIATCLDLGCLAPCCLCGASLLQAGEGAAGLLARCSCPSPAAAAGAGPAPFPHTPAALACFGGLGRDAPRRPPCLNCHAVGARATLCTQAQCATRAATRMQRTPTLLHSLSRPGIARLPWVCTVDHDARALVVCLRGTLHLEDVATDALAQATCVGGTPEGAGIASALTARLMASSPGAGAAAVDLSLAYVHTGFWATACAVRRELVECGALACAAGGRGEGSGAPLSLVLVGHSLGAGVAAVLALQLLPDFPSLHCFAYAPPTAVASPLLAQQCQPFVTTVALGQDVVVGLTVDSLRSLLRGAAGALQRSKKSKARLQAAFCARSVGLCLLPWRARVALGLAERSEDSVERKRLLLPGRGGGGGVGGGGGEQLQPLQAVVVHSPLQLAGAEQGTVVAVAGAGTVPQDTRAAAPASMLCEEETSRPWAMPGKVLHLKQTWEGPRDCLSLGLTWLCGGACRLVWSLLAAPYLALLLLLKGREGLESWRGAEQAEGGGACVGDALASLLWCAVCCCSWRVRREYTPQWVSGNHFCSKPGIAMNVAMRGMVEHREFE